MQVKRSLRLILLSCFITLALLVFAQHVYRLATNIRQQTVADIRNWPHVDTIVTNKTPVKPVKIHQQPPTTQALTLTTLKAAPDLKLPDPAPENELELLQATITADAAADDCDDIATTVDIVPTLSQRLQSILKCKNRELAMEKVQYGRYWLVRNFIRGSISRSVGCAETITYTTNGDYTFFGSLAMVVSRWLAPISFAIFAPGYDINGTMDSIQYVRNCLPESELIRQYVSFHIYFPADHMPTKIPLNEEQANKWKYNCKVAQPPYENVDRKRMYKTAHNLTYPINVGRNIARFAVNTHFIFACDIELIPSVGLVQQFLELVARNHTSMLGANKLRVFVLPVFEMKLEKNLSMPHNKTEMVKLYRRKKVIAFHANICTTCHLVPLQAEWLNASDSAELSIFSMSKRERKFAFWEPFYISDNREPMFDERVTWEGQSNKRIQGYAMCLLGYEYHILHPGFLMHTPGIKFYKKNSERAKFVPPMNRLIKSTIMPEYKILYGNNNARCRV